MHYNNQRLGIVLLVISVIALAIFAPITTSDTIVVVALAVVGGFLIDG